MVLNNRFCFRADAQKTGISTMRPVVVGSV